MPENGSINDTTSTGTGTGSAPALSQAAQDYGQKISEVANQHRNRRHKSCGSPIRV